MRKIGTPECKHDKRKDVHNEVLHFFLKRYLTRALAYKIYAHLRARRKQGSVSVSLVKEILPYYN